MGPVHPGEPGMHVGIGAVPSATTIALPGVDGVVEVAANAHKPRNINSNNRMRVIFVMGEASPCFH